MASNISVQRFKALTQKLKDEVHRDAVTQLNTEADGLVRAIESVAPRGSTGELVHSVRKLPGKRDTIVRVVEGSPATIKAGYQYPRADEFGTIHMAAKPHFFPTYRLLKPGMISRMKRKLTTSIRKRSAAQ